MVLMTLKIYEYVSTCGHMDLFNKYLLTCLEPVYRDWRYMDFQLCWNCLIDHLVECENSHLHSYNIPE